MTYFLVVHPDYAEQMKRVDARANWYAQHRENRLAKRERRTPRPIERICGPGELGKVLGFQFITMDKAAP